MSDKFRKICPVFVFMITLTMVSLNACAQTKDHRKNQQYLNEMKSIEESAVLLNNQAAIIPLKNLEKLNIASVNIGFSEARVFDSLLSKYASIRSFTSENYNSGGLNLDDLQDDLKFHNLVIIQVTDQSLNDPTTLPFLIDLQKNKQIILNVFGNVQALHHIHNIGAPVIWSEKKSSEAATVTAQIIFGGIPAGGRLPIRISAKYPVSAGFSTLKSRLKFTVPEEVGINTEKLTEIDKIAQEAISERATPSVVVMAVKDGKVIFNKAYGTHTYKDPIPAKVTDIYDLASVTKISATTMAVMRLYEDGKLKLDTNVGAYIPSARKTNKNDIPVREVMLHQAGFIPYIPFYRKLVSSDYSRDSSAAYPTKVADNYFLRKGYFDDVMWPEMLNSALANRGKYVYSDLSMYFMKDIVERRSGQPLDRYVQKEFYQPLGMYRAGFNPRLRFARHEIVPTEDDQAFRKTLLEGYVHDQGAAMAGGVSGHAGLFSSANDLAILYQMLLDGGTYGGREYFKPETIQMFTAKQSEISRRGLGFDRWDPDSKNGYPSKLASPQTYGHTGYTGTCVWVDPRDQLIYIFLSNRVHPGVSTKLLELNIRSRIQDVLYDAIR